MSLFELHHVGRVSRLDVSMWEDGIAILTFIRVCQVCGQAKQWTNFRYTQLGVGMFGKSPLLLTILIILLMWYVDLQTIILPLQVRETKSTCALSTRRQIP